MKCQIPEISWHNRDPVLSVDIQPRGANDRDHQYRLASGGTDSHVLIWYMIQTPECGTINLELAADLTRHQRAVNAVRWSPSGELLASGDDESVIFIWKQKGETETLNILENTNDQDKETWLTMKILRGHMEDVYDLSWSANSQFLISGSVDNSAIVWDVQRGKSQAILQDHKGFVQGVAWDPQNKYLATLSTDRYFRVYDVQTRRVVSRCHKCVLPVPKDHPLRDKTIRLYHDDTLQTFFRRLSFSPDGNIIVTPSGMAEIEGVSKPLNTTYIFTRNSLKQPSFTLPSPDQYTVAVRFCPVYFQHRPHAESKPPLIPLPYRMVFAVATKSSVYLYDTQQAAPFALISNIHYTRLTDMSWSSDGRILIVSSTDGFCSMIFFTEGELGTIYQPPSPEASAADEPSTSSKADETKMMDDDSKSTPPPKEKQDKPAQPIAFRRKPKPEETSTPSKADEIIIDDDSNSTPPPQKGDNGKKPSSEKPAQPIAIRRKPKLEESKTPPKVDEMKMDDDSNSTPPPQKDDNGKKPSSEKPPQPIAIRRKPKPEEPKTPPKEDAMKMDDDSESTPPQKDDTSKKQEKPAQPIAIRRKPKPAEPKPTTSEGAVVVSPTVENIVQPGVEFVIEKEKIISSDEKFESPSKKDRPVTPIAVRRHPRTPSDSANESKAGLASSSSSVGKNSPKPIAIRRHPRTLEAGASKPTVEPTAEEDANDTWPIDQPKPVGVAEQKKATLSQLPCPMETDQTEDIVLLVESDGEEEAAAAQAKESDSEAQKTPRRVEFRTISTPKSKKKLL
ncbi:chromatin assembly factor 1 subunit B [Anopheles merus]|uniref:CAF1B/HIR1 beta-propeller domain-containing protein n=1 Tax=Anopheles merus TaxID=30066 RepID=A0A182VKU4_ANOME|nr:chromatin assembly factor 1 subunit B [Anopheles merus]